MNSAEISHQFETPKVSGAAMKAFFNLTSKWQLSAKQQRTLIGSPSETTFFRWKANPESATSLSRDTLDRISYLLGIHKAACILFPSKEFAYHWVNEKVDAPLFGGGTPLSYMLQGSLPALADVRRYLDAERG